MGVADDHAALVEEWNELHEYYAGITSHYPTYRRKTVITEEQQRRELIANLEYLIETHGFQAKCIDQDALHAAVKGDVRMSRALSAAAAAEKQLAETYKRELDELRRGDD